MRFVLMLRRHIPSLSSILFFILFSPLPAFSVQAHGGAEGLVSHQVGHILFFAGMVFLLLRLSRLGVKTTGWIEFKFFLWFIVFWNCLTFTGHWMREYVPPERFVKAGDLTVAYAVGDLWDVLFYFSNLDHLLLFPSFLLLLLALRKWNQTT